MNHAIFPRFAVTSLLLVQAGSPALQAEPATNRVRVINDVEFARPGGVALLMNLFLPEGIEKPPQAVFQRWLQPAPATGR